MSDNDSDDSDEWGAADLPEIPKDNDQDGSNSEANQQEQPNPGQNNDTNDDDWMAQLPSATPNDNTEQQTDKKQPESFSMIIVDLTLYTNDEIHSKFDANAVNDPVAVKKHRLELERQYDAIAKDATLLANGTVIPCGSSVWRPALERLRRERAGHYCLPLFPPKKK